VPPEIKPLWRPYKKCGVWPSYLEDDDESVNDRCMDYSREQHEKRKHRN